MRPFAWALDTAAFIDYYGIDPIDMSLARFYALMQQIGPLEQAKRPKTLLETALEDAQRQEQAYKRKKAQQEKETF